MKKTLDERIMTLFKNRKNPLYFSDICEKLNTDLEETVEACRRLLKKKKLFIAEESKK